MVDITNSTAHTIYGPKGLIHNAYFSRAEWTSTLTEGQYFYGTNASNVYAKDIEAGWHTVAFVVNENGTTSLSPTCSSIFEKSTLRLSILAGVPVLKRNISIPRFFKESVK